MGDSGTVHINTDDAVLTGKVRYLTKDCLLILFPNALVCRQFASNIEIFALPLDQLRFARKNQDESTMTIGGLFPRESSHVYYNNTMFMEFTNRADRDEWSNTLNFAIADRAERARQRKEEKEKQQSNDIAELSGMFPSIDTDVIQTMYANSDNSLVRAIDALLVISDPSYQPVGGSAPPTSTSLSQMEQDEMIAKALQDELFMEEMRAHPELRATIPRAAVPPTTSSGSASRQASSSSPPTSPTVTQKLSGATRLMITNLYQKFRNRQNHNSGYQQAPTDDDENGAEAQEMQSMASAPRPAHPHAGAINDDGEDAEQNDDDHRLVDTRRRGGPVTTSSAATQVQQGKETPALLVAVSDDDGL